VRQVYSEDSNKEINTFLFQQKTLIKN